MAEIIRLMIELRSPAAEESLSRGEIAAEFDDGLLPPLPGFTWDRAFPLISIPGAVHAPEPVRAEESFAPASPGATWIACGEVERTNLDQWRSEAEAYPEIVGVWSNPPIELAVLCPDSPGSGTEAEIATLLAVEQMVQQGLDGSGVPLALVDTGSNQDFLHQRGKTQHTFDAAHSLSIRPDVLPPGRVPLTPAALSHGTMTAYDALIAAPRAILRDVAVVLPGTTQQHLDRVLWGFKGIYTLALAARNIGQPFSLVVSNSWALSDPDEDLPANDPGNFISNPQHVVNRMVAALDAAGVDVVFAAGNCGPSCPFPSCRASGATIYGANSHPQALCVGGVDVTGAPLGYSSIGPGFLGPLKPDLCGFAHFSGSGLSSRDIGTSTAAPVVAGVLAALRTRLPYDPVQNKFPPSYLRGVLRATARRQGNTHDRTLGWGVINPAAAAAKLFS